MRQIGHRVQEVEEDPEEYRFTTLNIEQEWRLTTQQRVQETGVSGVNWFIVSPTPLREMAHAWHHSTFFDPPF